MKRREFITAAAALLFRHGVRWRRGHVVGLAFSPWMVEPTIQKTWLEGCETTAGMMEKPHHRAIVMRPQDRLPASPPSWLLSPICLSPQPTSSRSPEVAAANVPDFIRGG
jgi:hypothetical protein